MNAVEMVWTNAQGQVVRSSRSRAQQLYLVRHKKSRRIQVLQSLNTSVDSEFKDYQMLSSIPANQQTQLRVGDLNLLVKPVLSLPLKPMQSDSTPQNSSWGLVLVIFALLIFILAGLSLWGSTAPTVQAEVPAPVETVLAPVQVKIMKVPQTKQVEKLAAPSARASRSGLMNALLGVKNSALTQKGGLKFSELNSAGIGAGGLQGSGGVQTSLYGRGMVGAALGTGHQINGLGGIGTLGRGGGQAGYGQESLIGQLGQNRLGQLEGRSGQGSALGSGQVGDVVKKNLAEIRYCYEAALQKAPQLAGRVLVNFRIDPMGKVLAANVQQSSLNSSQVENCVIEKVKHWNFPRTGGATPTMLTYPFVFQKAGQG